MSEDIFFKNKKEDDKKRDISFRDSLFVEHISSEQLEREPGELAFGDIITDSNERITHDRKNQKIKETKKKKHHFFRNTVLILLFIVIAAVSAFTGLLLAVMSDYTPAAAEENTYISPENMYSSPDIYNVLFIGCDSAFTEASPQAGSLALLSVSEKEKTVKITVFDGRIKINIPGRGHMPLDFAINNLPAKMTADTFEFNFGIKTDAYVKYNYSQIAGLADAAGSVALPDIDGRLAEIMAEQGFEVTPGTGVNANGDHALVYIRAGIETDCKTGAENMMSVILSAVKKAPADFYKELKNILGSIESDLDKNSMAQGVRVLINCLNNDISYFGVPLDDTWYEENSDAGKVKIINFESNIKNAAAFIYE